MITVDVPDLELHPVAMEPRETRGDELEEEPGQLLLGGPFWTPINAAPHDDAEMSAFLGEPGYRWALGVLALSIHVDKSQSGRYERAWVNVELATPDAGAAEPIAWSMRPDRVSSPVKRSTSVTLTPKLTIEDLGIEGGIERGIERTLQDVSLDALNEKTPTPRWVLRRTKSAELSGCTRLALVVRAPAEADVEARLDVGCVTARRKLVFFWSKTPHEQRRRVSRVP
jgi:hypothetical protein